MKQCGWFFVFCQSLFAQGIFDSQAVLEQNIYDNNVFYEEVVAEQEYIDRSVGLGRLKVVPFSPPALPSAPSNPSNPGFEDGYLAFVIVNNSGISADDIYITIIGAQVIGVTAQDQKMYVTFDGSGLGSYTDVPSGMGSGSVPNTQLSSLPSPSANHYAFYIPANDNDSDGISGSRVYFQLNSSDELVTYDNSGLLTEPSVLNQSLDSYSISFDKFEFAYLPMGSPQVAANATAVDFFCIPLYAYLSTPDAGSSGNSGIFASQSFVMSQVVPYFFDNKCTGNFKSAILGQWNNLFSPNRTSPIRILSPGAAASVGTSSTFPNQFDPNYFDNATTYGFSLIQYLWSGSRGYYKTNDLYFQIPLNNDAYPQPGPCSANGISGIYTATINSSNFMNLCPSFTTESQSFLSAPTTAGATAPSASGPTSYLIFSAQNLNPTFAANLQGNQVSKLFEEALIAGLLPAAFTPSNPLSNTYLSANSANYYNNSSNLPFSAGGPWYDLYSQAIHYCGTIYAFGFDEPLYPNVLMQCTTPTSSTYIGITIGTCDLAPVSLERDYTIYQK